VKERPAKGRGGTHALETKNQSGNGRDGEGGQVQETKDRKRMAAGDLTMPRNRHRKPSRRVRTKRKKATKAPTFRGERWGREAEKSGQLRFRGPLPRARTGKTTSGGFFGAVPFLVETCSRLDLYDEGIRKKGTADATSEKQGGSSTTEALRPCQK